MVHKLAKIVSASQCYSINIFLRLDSWRVLPNVYLEIIKEHRKRYQLYYRYSRIRAPSSYLDNEVKNQSLPKHKLSLRVPLQWIKCLQHKTRKILTLFRWLLIISGPDVTRNITCQVTFSQVDSFWQNFEKWSFIPPLKRLNVYLVLSRSIEKL